MYPELEGLNDEEALEVRRKLIAEQEAEIKADSKNTSKSLRMP